MTPERKRQILADALAAFHLAMQYGGENLSAVDRARLFFIIKERLEARETLDFNNRLNI